MKKKNLKIDQLHVESFVTTINSDTVDTVKGGQTYNCPPPTYTCPPTEAGCGGSSGCGVTVWIRCDYTGGITICDFTACNA